MNIPNILIGIGVFAAIVAVWVPFVRWESRRWQRVWNNGKCSCGEPWEQTIAGGCCTLRCSKCGKTATVCYPGAGLY